MRDKLIEAVNAELDAMAAEDNIGWNPDTARILDAMLGVLENHADEWPTSDTNHVGNWAIRRLLDQLKGETE